MSDRRGQLSQVGHPRNALQLRSGCEQRLFGLFALGDVHRGTDDAVQDAIFNHWNSNAADVPNLTAWSHDAFCDVAT